MSLPFTEAQFLDTFAGFNAAVWPVLGLLWLASLVLAIRLFAGRPQARALGVLLALQWMSGVVYLSVFLAPINPAAGLFAALFAVQALALVWYGLSGGGLRVSRRWSIRQVGAILFILSALVYPGLALLAGLEASRAPLFGVPCPTVLFTTGVLLAAAPPAPRWLLAIPVLWAGIGGSAALVLGMTQDWLLLGAGAALVADGLFGQARPHRVRASRAERDRPRVVDRFVTQPNYRQVLVTDIDARPEHIWPWLVQMGYQRGGLYSYDWLDRVFGFLDRPSATRILPAFQELRPGDVIPVGRGGGFPVAAVDPCRSLVLAGAQDEFAWGWELALDPVAGRRTRLISRNLGRTSTAWRSRAFLAVLRPAAFVMTHRMLTGIKRRAEALARSQPAPRRQAA
jgi:hypothetical protein